MSRTEAEKRADRKYKAARTKQVVIRFYPGDWALYDHLCEQDSKMGYIKRLIARDMDGRPGRGGEDGR